MGDISSRESGFFHIPFINAWMRMPAVHMSEMELVVSWAKNAILSRCLTLLAS